MVPINTNFVAIDASYCNKLYRHCNMATVLRQKILLREGSHFVVIETRHFNRITIRGNIRKDIATQAWCCISYKYCCKKVASYCNKLNRRCNMITILRQKKSVARSSHFVAIETRYFNRITIRGNIRKDIATSVWHCISYK